MANRAKSIELKKLQGTYRRDRVVKYPEAEKGLKTLPKPPETLKGMGLEYYLKQGAEYLQMGCLNQFNLPLFLDVCFYISQKEGLSKKIEKARNISDYARYRKLYDDANQRQRLCMVELKLTTVKIKSKADEDPFLKILADNEN